MGKLWKENQLIGKSNPGKIPKIIRRQHCFDCDTVLALEITDRLGFGGEYWWIKNGIWVKEKWYGNHFKCPKCGIEGNLPGDKPLSTESVQKNQEKLKEKLNGEQTAS